MKYICEQHSEKKSKVILSDIDWQSGSCTGLPAETRGLSSKPRITTIGPEMTEIWSKQCLDHISVISGPILMILGSLESPRVSAGRPVHFPAGSEANFTSIVPTTNVSVPALGQHHHSPVFKGFWKVRTSSNGPGMIQRP